MLGLSRKTRGLPRRKIKGGYKVRYALVCGSGVLDAAETHRAEIAGFEVKEGDVVEKYEVVCDGVAEARCFRFDDFNAALVEAERVCKKHQVQVRVVVVIGCFVPEARWISNGDPGYPLSDWSQESQQRKETQVEQKTSIVQSTYGSTYGAAIGLQVAITELCQELCIDTIQENPRMVMLSVAELRSKIDRLVELIRDKKETKNAD